MEFTILDEWGRVMMTGITQHLDIPLAPGQRVIEEQAPLDTYRSGESWVKIPAQPSPVHEYDWSIHAWVDRRSLAVLQAEKWEEIKAARTRFIAAGVVVGALGRFDADPSAAVNITGTYAALDALPEDWTVVWTRFDNSSITLTKDQFREVALAVLGHVNHAYDIARGLRDQIDESSMDGLAAIRWPE